MQSYQSNILARPDTLLGICHALGEDFGFNPLFLRVAFAAPLLWDPITPVAIYLSLGLLVAASRLLYPNPQATVRRAAIEAAPEGQQQRVANDPAQPPLILAEARDLAEAA